MKKVIALTGFMFFSLYIGFGQIINLNPDPNGELWAASAVDIIVTTGNCENPPVFQPTQASLNKPLPVAVHNENRIWWPYIINQGQFNSCVQVAEIFYTFTYEINRKRNLFAGDNENENEYKSRQYNQHYTYNQSVTGNDQGSSWHSGFCMIRDNGCPNYEEFYDPEIFSHKEDTVYTYWMTGSSKYISGMDNRISEIYKFPFGTNTGNLNYLKHWIADHGRGEATGGLAVIGVFIGGSVLNIINQPGSYNGNSVLYLGSSGPHALTIVGYDDNVPISATESGAFKVANSWGGEASSWGDFGFAWLPYSALVTTNNGLRIDYAYTCDVYPTEDNPINEPEISIAVNIEHEFRSKLLYYVGHDKITDIQPQFMEKFETFSKMGNENQMRGIYYPGAIDIGLNFSHFYIDNTNNPFQRVFFKVYQFNTTAVGQINSINLVDHRWNEEFELPFQIADHTIYNEDNLYWVDYYLLPHHANNIFSYTELRSNRVSRFTTQVINATLSLSSEKEIHMYNSEILINAGSTLALKDGSKIIAKRGMNKIIIDGSLSLGSNVQFITENEALLEIHLNGSSFTLGSGVKFLGNNGGYIDLYLNNESGTVNMLDATFERTNIISKVGYLNIDGCEISNYSGYLYCKRGNVDCSNSTFINTGLYLSNSSGSLIENASVVGCTFTNTVPFMEGIVLDNYGNYSVLNNHIDGYFDGINLFYAGNGTAGNQVIENNVIHSCQMNGIIAYNSVGSINRNNIYNNYFGVRFMNNCSFDFRGDPYAQAYNQTQQIRNNSGIDIYASEFGFPWYFRYNSISDPYNLGNPSDPLLEWDRPLTSQNILADVRLNNWGYGFSLAADLKGNNVDFLVYPIWIIGFTITPTPDEDLYTSALSNFKAGNYAVAKNLYQLLIELYPKSKFAEAAMKDLVRLEEFSGKDFYGLKQYLLTNDSISADTTLKKLADISANQCDVKMENWPTAISWYENRILYPENLADSIFAVIDLGYVYLLMEDDSLKSAFTGKLPEYKPVNKAVYTKNKDYLLSLLPGNNHSIAKTENYSLVQGGSLFQNSPNPTNDQTTISYYIEIESRVEILLSDLSGKEIIRKNLGVKPSGTHTLELNLKPITSGLYIYSLILNGTVVDVKKLSVVD